MPQFWTSSLFQIEGLGVYCQASARMVLRVPAAACVATWFSVFVTAPRRPCPSSHSGTCSCAQISAAVVHALRAPSPSRAQMFCQSAGSRTRCVRTRNCQTGPRRDGDISKLPWAASEGPGDPRPCLSSGLSGLSAWSVLGDAGWAPCAFPDDSYPPVHCASFFRATRRFSLCLWFQTSILRGLGQISLCLSAGLSALCRPV